GASPARPACRPRQRWRVARSPRQDAVLRVRARLPTRREPTRRPSRATARWPDPWQAQAGRRRSTGAYTFPAKETAPAARRRSPRPASAPTAASAVCKRNSPEPTCALGVKRFPAKQLARQPRHPLVLEQTLVRHARRSQASGRRIGVSIADLRFHALRPSRELLRHVSETGQAASVLLTSHFH